MKIKKTVLLKILVHSALAIVFIGMSSQSLNQERISESAHPILSKHSMYICMNISKIDEKNLSFQSLQQVTS